MSPWFVTLFFCAEFTVARDDAQVLLSYSWWCPSPFKSCSSLQSGQELPGLASIFAEEGPDSLVSLQDLLAALALLFLHGIFWYILGFWPENLGSSRTMLKKKRILAHWGRETGGKSSTFWKAAEGRSLVLRQWSCWRKVSFSWGLSSSSL